MNDRPTRPAAPIESFGAELFNALIQGSQKRFEIKGLTFRQAVTFRHRCHMLRNRMRIDNHPLASVASRAKIHIEWDRIKIKTRFNKKRMPYPEDPNVEVTVIISPHDSEFRDVLKAAGLDVNRPVDTDGTPATPEPQDSSEAKPTLDQLLKDV